MSKVLLITPPYHCGVVESAGRWPHLGFIYIAGSLREAGHEVVIYDAMSKDHGYEDIEARIALERPDVVASTAYTATLPTAVEVLRLAKRLDPKITTIIGGIHPTFMYREMLDDPDSPVDFVVRGEGEETFPELLVASDPWQVAGLAYRKDGLVVATPERPFITDLDALKPAWDLLEWEDYLFYVFPGARLGIVSSSRGCSMSCAFCSQQRFWHQTWRARQPESFVTEVEHLARAHNVDVLFISDEYPTKDRERWERILDLLIERDLGIQFLMETRVDDIVRDEDIMWKYRQAGIIHIYVGVEATSQDKLDLFNKELEVHKSKLALEIIDKAGIISETAFVLGTPEETKTSIKRTLKLAQEYNPDFAHFLLLSPWPYADMYEQLKPYIEDFDYANYNLVEPVVKPAEMTRAELFAEVLNCYKKFYMAKLPEWAASNDEFKKRYALLSMKAITSHSFLQNHVLGLGKMPALIEKYLSALGADVGVGV